MSGDERLLKAGLVRRLLGRPELGAMGGAIIVWCFFAIVAGPRGFVSLKGTATFLEVAAELGILAVAVSLLIIGGEFDLSVGSIIGATGMITSIVSVQFGAPIWLAMIVSLAVALGIGFVNGTLVVRTGLPSFIITLGMLFIIRGLTIGLTRLLTGRTQVGELDSVSGFETVRWLFAGDITIGEAEFPVSILWWLACAALATFLLLRTKFGNWIFGVGGAKNAARMVGVPVERVKIALFMGTAAAAWLVATIQVVTFNGADVLRGEQREFHAIIAAVIGGTLLTGGYGSAIGAALGALIFGMVRQGIVFAGVDADWFQVFLGGMLVAAVLVNNYVRKKAAEVKR